MLLVEEFLQNGAWFKRVRTLTDVQSIQGSPSYFFLNKFSNAKIFIIYFQVSWKRSQKIPVKNVTEDYQEYFYVEKVVAKNVPGGNPWYFLDKENEYNLLQNACDIY